MKDGFLPCNLKGKSFQLCYLVEQDFSQSELQGTNFSRANLYKANLVISHRNKGGLLRMRQKFVA
jgi:uncharacterized protein YjbI with pentapeptide repeats